LGYAAKKGHGFSIFGCSRRFERHEKIQFVSSKAIPLKIIVQCFRSDDFFLRLCFIFYFLRERPFIIGDRLAGQL
jgi:hypothetical protein